MPKYLAPHLQPLVEYRDGDILISVPAKSGTTWTMNIVHQLRSGGDPDVNVYDDVPWIEYRERPDQTDEELLERWKAMPRDVPRAFKTHSAPGGPFLKYMENVKYVVVCRNPEEALVSFRHMIMNHDPRNWALWNTPMEEAKETWYRDDFKTWYHEVGLKFSPPGAPPIPGGFQTLFYWSFIAGWWPHRNKPNVLMLHFKEMKADHEGTIRKIADFLGFKPTEEQWPKVLEYTSFPWMKEHGLQFQPGYKTDAPMLLPDTMVRKGVTGDQAADGMTPEIAADMKEWAKKIVQDEAAIKYIYEGGPIPPDA